MGSAKPSIHIFGIYGVHMRVSILAGLYRAQTFTMSILTPYCVT